jgi:hypothetical protein
MIRQSRSQAAVAHLAAQLTGEYDPELLLQYICDQAVRCLDLVLATLVVMDGDQELNLLAVGSDRVIDSTAQALHVTGPSAESARNGGVSISDDIRADPGRWPDTARRMAQLQLVGARGFPMRLAGRSIGSLTLYSEDAWGAERGSLLGQTFADFAVLVLIHHDLGDHRLAGAASVVATLVDQRALIYQAQGMIAEAVEVTMDKAIGYLEAYARQLSVPVASVAQRVVELTLPLTAFGEELTED